MNVLKAALKLCLASAALVGLPFLLHVAYVIGDALLAVVRSAEPVTYDIEFFFFGPRGWKDIVLSLLAWLGGCYAIAWIWLRGRPPKTSA